ncbi:MAG: hypothetical protein JST84_05000 [Acidobacteria bacterium]|nr:hypothetical protein [Acidobacteriota bacterium]
MSDSGHFNECCGQTVGHTADCPISTNRLTIEASQARTAVRQHYPTAVAQEMHGANSRKWNIYRFPYASLNCIINADTQSEAWVTFAKHQLNDFALIDQIDSSTLRDLIEETLAPTAKRFRKKSLYWVNNGPDESISYCYQCAEKEVKRLKKENPNGEYFIGGGYSFEEDSQSFCETCGCLLQCSFTNYACEEEMRHFGEYSFDFTSPSDCDSFREMCNTLDRYDPGTTCDLSYQLHILTRQIAVNLYHYDRKFSKAIQNLTSEVRQPRFNLDQSCNNVA